LSTRVPPDRDPILLITVVVDVDGSQVEVEGSFRGDSPTDVGEFLDAGEALVAIGSGLAHTLPNRDRLRKLHFSFDIERRGWVAVYGVTEDAEGFTFGQLMPPDDPGSAAAAE